MQKQSLSNAQILARICVETLVSYEFIIFVASFLLQAVDSTQSSLFGRDRGESLTATFSFSPANSLQLNQLNKMSVIRVLTYPMVHANWSHWLSTAPVWLALAYYFRSATNKYGLSSSPRLFLQIGATALIAFSYFAPFAPHAQINERVLGLSALALFQLGALVFLRPHWTIWPFGLAMGYAFISTSPTDGLSTWGHAVGFTLGLITGLWIRSKSSASSATSA
jgi:membrane associated rhomboid family serine protease